MPRKFTPLQPKLLNLVTKCWSKDLDIHQKGQTKYYIKKQQQENVRTDKGADSEKVPALSYKPFAHSKRLAASKSTMEIMIWVISENEFEINSGQSLVLIKTSSQLQKLKLQGN